MRELERHPEVVHVPPPHLWQLSPPSTGTVATGKLPMESLVVTLELHIRDDLDDESVILMTRWAWDRVTTALGGKGACEVTVGVVRE